MILLKAAADLIYCQTRSIKNTLKQRSLLDHLGRLFYNCLVYGGFIIVLFIFYKSPLPEKIYYHINFLYIAISSGVYALSAALFFLGSIMEEYELMHSKKAVFLFYNYRTCRHLFCFYLTKYFWWAFKLLSVIFVPVITVIIKINTAQNNMLNAFSDSSIFIFFWFIISIFVSSLFIIFVCIFPRIKLLLSKKFIQLISIIVWFSFASVPFYYIHSVRDLRSVRETQSIKEDNVMSLLTAVEEKIGSQMQYDPVFIIVSTFSCRTSSKLILHFSIFIFIILISLYAGYLTFKLLYYNYPSYINERYRKNNVSLSSTSFFSKSSLFTALVFREWIYFKRVSLKILLMQSIMIFPFFFMYKNSELIFLLNMHPYNILFLMFGAVFFLNVFIQGYDPSKQLGGFNYLKKVPICGKKYMLFLSFIYSLVISLIIIIFNIVLVYFYNPHMRQFSLILFLSLAISIFITFSHFNNRHFLYSILIESINSKIHYSEYADIFSMMMLAVITSVYCVLLYYRSTSFTILFTLIMIIVNFFCFTYAQKLFQPVKD